ncbi:MAG: SpoIID/LytB protein [Frankiales bacterium]|nr:SpoIID/LytB protein [Frankiales bacterium]
MPTWPLPRRFPAAAALLLFAATVVAIGAASQPAAAAPICTSSAPLTTTAQLWASWDQISSLARTSYQATDGHGTFAGVSYNGVDSLKVIKWRAGITTVLDEFTYAVGQDYDPSAAVRVAGISAAGDVVVVAQRVGLHVPLYRFQGFRYSNGHRYTLAQSASWSSVEPSSVNAAGLIVGTVRGTDWDNSHVVEWTGPGSGRVSDVGGVGTTDAAVDSRGDIAYDIPTQFMVGTVKLANRAVIKLANIPPVADAQYVSVEGAIGNIFYGRAIVDNHADRLVTWTLPPNAAAGSTVLPKVVHNAQYALAAGNSGDFVLQTTGYAPGFGTQLLFMRDGFTYPLPAQPPYPEPLYVVDPTGAVVYTDHDGAARFYRCHQNPADHSPRGALDGPSVKGSTVTLRGWAFDPDATSASLSVDVYDQTSGRHMVGRFAATGASPDVDKARGIKGNHRYSVTFAATDGRHTYCVYAINAGYGTTNPALGCRSVLVHGAPSGALDHVTASSTTATLSGWAIDADAPAQALKIHIYDATSGNRFVGAFDSTVARPDVNRVKHVSGVHGYAITIPTTAGRHVFCSYAINVGPPATNPRLGCQAVTAR